MQYFNDSNSEVEYIKDILRTEYIPTVRMFSTEANIQPEFKTSSVIYSAGDSGTTISEEANSLVFEKETIVLDEIIKVGVADDSTNACNTHKANYIEKYRFGKRYPNITTNYVANQNYYSTDIHEHLGNYLRAYRDFYGIDVMNFYNCFSNRYITDYSLPIPVSTSKSSELNYVAYDSNYRVTAFPIRWDTSYRVKMYSAYSAGTITLQAVYFNGVRPLGAAEIGISSTDRSKVALTHVLPCSAKEFEITIGSLISNTGDLGQEKVSFSGTNLDGNDDDAQVIGYTESTYNTDTEIRNKLSKQSLLYLFMQYPAGNENSIVVIEQPKFTAAVNNELLNLEDSSKQVAFSDTLLEYLTGNVISPADPIHANVARVQEKVKSTAFYKKYGVGGPKYIGIDVPRDDADRPKTYSFPTGVFDKYLHQIIYKALFQPTASEQAYIDMGVMNPIKNFIGFVDKDVEARIMSV